MKFQPAIILGLLLFSAVAQADKPAWSGEGKPDSAQKQQHRQEMQAKDRSEELMSRSGADNTRDPQGQPKGLSEQQQRTLEEQKELGKGSEKGQEAREKRKKWWRFWE